MITADQAHALMVDGARRVAQRYGQYPIDNLTLLEYFVLIQSLLDEAIKNGSSRNVCIESDDREMYFQLSAGAMLLALQNHGAKMCTTYELRRALHPQQATLKGLLLEQEFIRAEAGDVFKRCYDSTRMNIEGRAGNVAFNEDDWQKLRSVLQRLGLKV